MDLQNYTNVNIFKKVYEQKQIVDKDDLIVHSHNYLSDPKAANSVQRAWNPYTNNMGTTIAIAGQDFCLIAADTRISEGYSIISREYSKTTQLTQKCCITSSGMVADIETLHKNLITKVKIYEREHQGRSPDTESLAQLLGNTLYGRRFMPFYAFNLLCGLNRDGQGVVYGYDAIGSYDNLTYGIQGSGVEMGAPLLDNQFVGHNHLVKKLAQNKQSVEEAAKDIINSIAERDIYTGDNVELVQIDSRGVSFTREKIRRD